MAVNWHNYIVKVHLEMEKTDDHAKRYNLKRGLEEVLGDRRELAIWTNLMLKVVFTWERKTDTLNIFANK